MVSGKHVPWYATCYGTQRGGIAIGLTTLVILIALFVLCPGCFVIESQYCSRVSASLRHPNDDEDASGHCLIMPRLYADSVNPRNTLWYVASSRERHSHGGDAAPSYGVETCRKIIRIFVSDST